MKIKELKIGDKTARIPLIQGGMGIGISGSRLAGAVAKEGCIGMLSGANLGYDEPDFNINTLTANLMSIEKHIDKAREISEGNGILGINIMVAMRHYKEIVETSVKKGIDLIVSGAGLAKNLPEYVKGTKTKIGPIVSSARAAVLMTKSWIKKYQYVPDLIIVEGPEAGGHLGFSEEELNKNIKLEDIVTEVIKEIHNLEYEGCNSIPIIAAGGIFDGKDMARFLKLGAAGVQMATRFVTTYECDASMEYKKAYIEAKEEDVTIVKSPVGMLGRALNNDFVKNTKDKLTKILDCRSCIVTCNPSETPYCITKALINAVKGKLDEALIFCGSNVHRLKSIVSVKELINEIQMELEFSM